MKKKIAFYIGWDILLTIFIYIRYVLVVWMKDYTDRTFNFLPAIWVPSIFMILAGAIIAILVVVSNNYKLTMESTIIELVVVGGFAFYLATISILPYLIIFISGAQGLPNYTPMWLYYDSLTAELGFIILGYELSILPVRIVKLKKIKNADQA